jgi:shikimate kinase
MEQSIIEKTVHSIKGRSIFLIGMMGSGKSQTGLKLAELLKYKYIDFRWWKFFSGY